MDIVINGLLIGVLATIGMDIWAAIAKYVLKLPTAHWNMVGRWFGHMPRGVFVHAAIAEAEPIRNELMIGWIAHYCTGIFYGVLYLLIVQGIMGVAPTLQSALFFGLVTLVAPWLIMQPAIGAGRFASNTPRPGVVRLVNLSMHLVFGACLYPAWLVSG